MTDTVAGKYIRYPETPEATASELDRLWQENAGLRKMIADLKTEVAALKEKTK